MLCFYYYYYYYYFFTFAVFEGWAVVHMIAPPPSLCLGSPCGYLGLYPCTWLETDKDSIMGACP